MSVHTVITKRSYVITDIKVYKLSMVDIYVKSNGKDIGFTPFLTEGGFICITFFGGKTYQHVTIRVVPKLGFFGTIQAITREYVAHQIKHYITRQNIHFDQKDSTENVQILNDMTPLQHTQTHKNVSRVKINLSGEPVLYPDEHLKQPQNVTQGVSPVELKERKVDKISGLYKDGVYKLTIGLEKDNEKSGIHILRYGFNADHTYFYSLRRIPTFMVLDGVVYNDLTFDSYEDGEFLDVSQFGLSYEDLKGKKINFLHFDMKLPTKFLVKEHEVI